MNTNGLTYKIKLVPNEITFICRGGETILNAALRAGIELPHGCTRGGCGVCKIKVKGKVDFGRVSKNQLSDEEKENGFCLSCRAIPLEDVEISLIDGSYVKVIDYGEFYKTFFRSKNIL